MTSYQRRCDVNVHNVKMTSYQRRWDVNVHNVKMTSYQRRCDVNVYVKMTSYQCRCDVNVHNDKMTSYQRRCDVNVHNVKMTSYQRRCDVITSHRRWYDVILTPTEMLIILVLNIKKSTIYYLLLCLKFAGRVANRVDPDETPRSAASHPVLHRLLRLPNTYGRTVIKTHYNKHLYSI